MTIELIKNFLHSSVNFFELFGGKVIEAYSSSRKNIEILDVSLVPTVNICTLYVQFTNRNLFGISDYIDAYKRYRQMRYDWWKYLESDKFLQWDSTTQVIGHFVPYLGENRKLGEAYSTEDQTSYGQFLINYNNIEKGISSYYIDVCKRYGIEWLLQDRNGIVIGPDIGLLYSILAYTQCFGKIGTFIDVGSGTGELSGYLLKNNLVDRLIVNEVSPFLVNHIKNYISTLAEQTKIEVDYQFTDALEMGLPETADYISLGIYYGAQPQFLKNYGYQLKSSLRGKGVLVIQSGMLEGKFNISSVVGNDKKLFDWDWYSSEYTLGHYFNFIESLFVADEVITLATDSFETMTCLKNKLVQMFNASEIPMMVLCKIP